MPLNIMIMLWIKAIWGYKPESSKFLIDGLHKGICSSPAAPPLKNPILMARLFRSTPGS
jgi:hypothetical protein